MLYFCWSITKRFLSVLVIFGKCFVFTKIVKKISKTVLPCSGDSVTGRTRRMPQSRTHTEIFRNLLVTHWGVNALVTKRLWIFFKNLGFHAFHDSCWRLVREWKVQSREVHKDFRGSDHDSLASGTSGRKIHLENFSKVSFNCSSGWL